LDSLALEIEPDSPKQAHVNIGYPDQREASDQIASPAANQQFKPGNDQEECRYVMAETVLTREQVEEFSLRQLAAGLTAFSAPFASFAKHFLMGNGPGYTGDWNGQQEQLDDLFADRFQLL